MVAQVEISLWTREPTYAGINIVPIHVAPRHRSVASANDFGKRFFFVAPRLWNYKCYVHIAVGVHAFRQSVACSAPIRRVCVVGTPIRTLKPSSGFCFCVLQFIDFFHVPDCPQYLANVFAVETAPCPVKGGFPS